MSKTGKKHEANWVFFGVSTGLGILLYTPLGSVYYLIGGVLLGLVIANLPFKNV
ncbi:MAG: hypothetical protein GX956_02565 [Firmicutes bacterium]|nr:hypothetical protein [Bacillota bacterium]